MSSATRLTPVQVTLLLCGAEIFFMTGFATYTTLLPALQREWGLSNSEAGLISGIYFAGYVAATPVLTSLTRLMPSRLVPPFPGVTPATTLVPYSFIPRAWNEPSRPVIP